MYAKPQYTGRPPKPGSKKWTERQARETLLLIRAAFKKSLHFFIEKAVWIEDKTVPEGKSLFKLWEQQKDALTDFLKHRLVVIPKARQLGVTWLALAYATWRMLFHPGYTVVAISKTESDAIELVDYRLKVFIFANLPPWLIQEKKKAPLGWDGLTWESNKHELTVYHPNGMRSRFVASSASPDAGRSLTANLLILDEWAKQDYARDIWTSAFPIVNRPGATVYDGQVLGISSGEPGTLFEEICMSPESHGFHLIFLPWSTDPRRTVEWYEKTKQALPTSYRKEYPATLEDAFSSGAQTAFPLFDPTPGGAYVCHPFKIPSWWPRWRSNDPGVSDPFAWYCFALAPDGRIIVYREYARRPEGERKTYSEQAREFAEMCIVGSEIGQPEYEHGEPLRERFQFTAVGHDAFRTNPETGKNLTDYYREGGIYDSIQAPRDRIGRYAAVLEAMSVREWPDNELSAQIGKHTAKLVIFSTCPLLIESLPILITDPNRPNVVKDSPRDHYYDALGYGLQAWGPYGSKPPEKAKTRLQKYKESLVKRRKRF